MLRSGTLIFYPISISQKSHRRLSFTIQKEQEISDGTGMQIPEIDGTQKTVWLYQVT